MRRLTIDAQYQLARAIAPAHRHRGRTEATCAGVKDLRRLLGDDLFARVDGRRVIDFGCGEGMEAIELARAGAAEVVGVDIRDDVLARARAHAAEMGVDDRCQFTTRATSPADIIVSLDAFEHFADPSAILDTMHDLLVDGGVVLISFGPPWYHPLGGHLFSVFPWAHVLLAEEALIRWRSHVRSDGATRFSEVEGGLNQMTIARFEQVVADSAFELELFEAVPIRRLRWIATRATREWTTAIVRCTLRKPAAARGKRRPG